MTQQPDATPKVVAGSDQAASEARPAPASQQNTPARAAQPDAPQESKGEDLSAKAADLERQLAEVRARAAGERDTVRVKVEEPHAGIIHNGIWVGNDWTEVPSHVVPDMMEGAANSGVVLTQEETES